MSVSFNRAQLIRVAEQALAEHQKARVAYQAEIDRLKAEHAKTYGGQSRERARTLRDQLTKALKRSGPITRDQIPVGVDWYRISELCYAESSDYDWKHQIDRPDGLLTPAQVTETKALLQVLKTAVGTEVTANELKLLGLKNLGPVFTVAAAESGKGVGK